MALENDQLCETCQSLFDTEIIELLLHTTIEPEVEKHHLLCSEILISSKACYLCRWIVGKSYFFRKGSSLVSWRNLYRGFIESKNRYSMPCQRNVPIFNVGSKGHSGWDRAAVDGRSGCDLSWANGRFLSTILDFVIDAMSIVHMVPRLD